MAPQLVLDPAAREHIVMLVAAGRSEVVDHSPDHREPIGRLLAGPTAESIQDFQVSSTGGRVVVTLQVAADGGDPIADLYVSTLTSDGWTAPTKVTDNARARRQVGVTDTDARTLGNVTVHSALHASVVPDRAGALHVLLTNRETSRHVDARADGWGGASATSRAYFMTIPGTVATEPATSGAQPGPTPGPVRASDAGPTSGASPAVVAAAERRLVEYDITQGGWLSGTELDACRCREYDRDGDGEVTKVEYMAGALGAGARSSPATGRLRGRSPAAAPSQAPSPSRPAASPQAPRATTRPGGTDALPTGRYNCYNYGAARPMPWKAGYGGAVEVPRSTVKYVMHLTITGRDGYQYLNRGTGSYAYDAASGRIDWRSGPFARPGYRAGFRRSTDGRPVIELDIEGMGARCIGPQG